MKSPHWHNAIWGNNNPLTSYFRVSRVPGFWDSRLVFPYTFWDTTPEPAKANRLIAIDVLWDVFWAVKRLSIRSAFISKSWVFLWFPHGFTMFYHRLKEVPGQHLTCLDRRSNEVLPPERKPRAWRTCFLTEVKNVNSGLVNSWLIDNECLFFCLNSIAFGAQPLLLVTESLVDMKALRNGRNSALRNLPAGKQPC